MSRSTHHASHSSLRASASRLLVGASTLALAGLGLAQLVGAQTIDALPASATSNPALHVAGNQLVNSAGQAVQLTGVDRSGTEYACAQGWGIFDGPSDAASITAMASWHVNSVRIPLNEDCWLGINGVVAAYSGANYRTAIVNYVSELNAAGLVAVLDLHWGAPGTQLATGQEQMPDADHAPAFWTSVASTFKTTPGVIFDLFNEPHDVSWSCWLSGCTLSNGTAVAGMQTLLNAVRATGATQPAMVEGLNWGGDMSGFLANEPVDPDHALVASAHIYNFSQCNTVSCWTSTIAPVAAALPLVTGELGETDCSAGFINSYMPWADAHGIGYLAWAWDAGSGWSCGSGPSLISSYNGTANSTFGAGYQAHLAALAATPTPVVTTTTTTTTTTVAPTTTTTVAAAAKATYTATVTSAWGSGAVVDLHIANTGTAPLGSSSHPWTVSFNLPSGTTISSIWNATLVSQNGTAVSAVAPSYTQSLAPGASIDVGWVEAGGDLGPSAITVKG